MSPHATKNIKLEKCQLVVKNKSHATCFNLWSLLHFYTHSCRSGEHVHVRADNCRHTLVEKALLICLHQLNYSQDFTGKDSCILEVEMFYRANLMRNVLFLYEITIQFDMQVGTMQFYMQYSSVNHQKKGKLKYVDMPIGTQYKLLKKAKEVQIELLNYLI